MSNRLQLHERVTIRSKLSGPGRPEDVTVRAHVYSVSGTAPSEPNRPGLLVDSLRVIIGPLGRELDPINDQVVHRGITYPMDGRPMGRYQRGKLHHWTINLERVTG